MNKIIEHIYLGDANCATGLNYLQSNNIKNIVNVTKEPFPKYTGINQMT